MIRYQLRCAEEHRFEGWFARSDAFDEQRAAGALTCPVCGSALVDKAPMAPAVVTGKAREKAQRAERAEAFRAYLREKAAYVGPNFAEEARAIHNGQAEDRLIWGEASVADAIEMAEEGLPVAPLPPELTPSLPEKLN